MNQQMGGGAAPQAPDMSKVFLSEKENLDLVKHEFALDAIEARLIGFTNAKRAFVHSEKSQRPKRNLSLVKKQG